MAITATSMALSDYQNYNFSSTDTGKSASTEEATVAKQDYNISDLSSALSSLDNSASVYSITNLDSYVNNAFKLSQTSESTTLSAMNDISSLAVTNLNQAAASSYLENKLGLTSSDSVDLNGVLTAENSAQFSQEESKLSAETGTLNSGAVSSYTNYLDSNSVTGGLFDSKS